MARRSIAAVLWARWGRRGATESRRGRLYQKSGCGLCVEALALLRPFVRQGRLALELVDISADPELFRRYCLSIPVLELEAGPCLSWPFGAAEVRQALEA